MFRNVSKEGKKYVVKHVAKGVWGGQNRSTIIHNFGDGIFRNLSKMVALWSSFGSRSARHRAEARYAALKLNLPGTPRRKLVGTSLPPLSPKQALR